MWSASGASLRWLLGMMPPIRKTPVLIRGSRPRRVRLPAGVGTVSASPRSGAPQRAQKEDPDGLSVEHFGHFIGFAPPLMRLA
jgi:hypothetical protein